MIDCQERLRDRFLFALLASTGMRIGQALGLRHEDVVAWERRIVIVPARGRAAAGRAARAARGAAVPVPGELMRLWSDYMHEEYGELDSRLRVREPVGGRGRPAAELRDGGQAGRAHAAAGRVSLHRAPVPAYVRDAGLSRRGALEVIGAVLTHRSPSLDADLHAPDRRGSPPRAGRARRARPGRGSGRDERRAAACDRRWPRAARLGGAVGAGRWRQRELPHGDLAIEHRGEAVVHFERIGQPWLKEAAKRWARARLLARHAPQTMSGLSGRDCARSARWLADACAGGERAAPRCQPRVLEDYMLWVRTSRLAPATRSSGASARCARSWRSSARTGWRGCRASAVIHGRGDAARRLPAAQAARAGRV